jgi:hypothetical protein
MTQTDFVDTVLGKNELHALQVEREVRVIGKSPNLNPEIYCCFSEQIASMVHTPDRRYIGDSYACAVVSLQHE